MTLVLVSVLPITAFASSSASPVVHSDELTTANKYTTVDDPEDDNDDIQEIEMKDGVAELPIYCMW